MDEPLQLGLDTFGDVTYDDGGALLPQAQVLRNLVEQGVLADSLGLDFIGVGEHHRDDFSVSAPEVVLAAIAARTEHIHLGSAVTVLSSDDPVRVFQRFATLDGISGGRAEVILGRGSFTESFPLFGYELADYGTLFEEKLELFAELLKEQPVTWSGTMRASLANQHVYPKTENGLKAWVGVGGSPESVVRTARYGLPMMLAVIGGQPAAFAPYVELYHRALQQFGHPARPVGMHSPGHVAATDAQALEELWPHFKANRDRIGRDRGWPPAQRSQFEAEAGPEGALVAGSPGTVAAKIARAARTLGLSRFDLKYSNGTMPHSQLMESIGLYAGEVAPRVRELLAA
ncbi:MAG: LLM class flavin-dependent oxidoreductase, partial [Actinomycetales bacterium]